MKLQISENRLLIGNPGSGKSTLWNCHLQQITFASGTTLTGGGLSDHLQELIVDLVRYMDTPGLADDAQRKKAAQEIQKALMAGGKYRLMFVLRSNGGRLNPEDITTMMLVLQASKQIGQDNYGIIINSCGGAWLRKVESHGFERWLSESLHPRLANLHLPTTKYVHLAPHINELFEMDSVIAPLSDATNTFLREGVPAFALDADLVENMNAESLADTQGRCAKYQIALDGMSVEREALAKAKEESDGKRRLAQTNLYHTERNATKKTAEYLEEIARKEKAKTHAAQQADKEKQGNCARIAGFHKQARDGKERKRIAKAERDELARVTKKKEIDAQAKIDQANKKVQDVEARLARARQQLREAHQRR